MAQTIPKISTSHSICALDTYNHTALQASMYVVEVDMSMIPPSGLSIVIKQNSSTKLTSIVPTAAQNHVRARIVLNCAINDVIGVVVSSPSASDSGPNAVQGILNIRVGSV